MQMKDIQLNEMFECIGIAVGASQSHLLLSSPCTLRFSGTDRSWRARVRECFEFEISVFDTTSTCDARELAAIAIVTMCIDRSYNRIPHHAIYARTYEK